MIIPWKVNILWWTIASLENNVAAKKLPASISSVKSATKSVFIPSSEIAALDASIFNPYTFESEYRNKSYIKFIWKWFGERKTIVIVRNKNKTKSSFTSIVDDTGIHIHSKIQNDSMEFRDGNYLLRFRIPWFHTIIETNEEFITDNEERFKINCEWNENDKKYIHVQNEELNKKADFILRKCNHFIAVKTFRINIFRHISLFEIKKSELFIINGLNVYHSSFSMGEQYNKTVMEYLNEVFEGNGIKQQYGL